MLLVYSVFLLFAGIFFICEGAQVRLCQENASFKECPTPCPPTCENPFPQQCTRMCLETGCECNPGYVLSEGSCIAFKDCPAAQSCRENETFVACKAGCPTDYCPTDDGQYFIACDPPYPCPAGCVCKGNYKRLSEDDDRCILASECPPVPCTRPNEVWNPCPSICLAEYCSDMYGHHELSECQKDYPHYCEPRCVCEPNYYKNESGVCVPRDQCPQYIPECGYNEEGVICRTICPPQNCDIAYTDYACTDPPRCEAGCDCIEGYLRDKDGICIPNNSCPGPSGQCQEHATYTDCLSACPATCENPSPEACIAVCRGSGCQCDPGFVAHNGECIEPENCPITSCDNQNSEYTECLSACPATCDDPFPEICTLDCRGAGCTCKSGFVLHEGRCIRLNECPGRQCQEHATYTDCLSACPATCENPSPEACIEVCRGSGCQCDPGFVAHNGECIVPESCPITSCDDENSEYTECLSACPATCDDPFPEICTGECRGAGCACKSGFVLHEGCCIPLNECPDPVQECGLNEVLSPCKITCPPQSCASIYTLYLCPQPEPPCEPGCNCIDGYLRNADGVCIPSDQCPRRGQCQEHATYTDCLSACPATCENPFPEACIEVCRGSGCQCDPGFVAHNGECIKPENCPGRQCQEHATYTDCLSACPATCENPSPEACIAVCRGSGCQCDPGFVAHDGECIEPQNCPVTRCDNENSEYTECLSACPATCDDPFPEICTRECRGAGCACKSGFVLHEGCCIPLNECPGRQCQEHATYTDCLSACPATCENPSLEACIAVCRGSGCQCDPGFVAHDGECIEPQNCPVTRCDNENSEYTECLSACPATCDDPFPEICTRECRGAGCACKSGFVLHEGCCIPLNECPGRQCQEHATYTDCLSACPATCENPSPEACIAVCRGSGCQCDPGFVAHDGECIEPQNCPVTRCDNENSEYTECLSACPATCDDPFPEICTRECRGAGCACKSGFVLHEGCCIPLNECPGRQCQEHATYTDCLSACPATCENPSPEACIAVCRGSGCQCDPGFVAHDGECIEPQNCPVTRCDNENSEYTECLSACPATCDDPFPEICTRECRGAGCACKSGFVLHEGCCIPLNECPGRQCQEHATYTDCLSACPATCENPSPEACIAVCRGSGCQCDPGFVAHDGECIEPQNCPVTSCDDENSEYTECLSACPATCDNPFPETCTLDCRGAGCTCKSGFVLYEGRCIRFSECPAPVQECGLNEVLSPCKITCPPQSCASIYASYLCPPRESNSCEPGCNCIDGYLRNADGVCIPSDQCPGQDQGCNGDPNAVMQACPWSSPATCDSPNAKYDGKCESPGCVCKSGYLLSTIGGQCILADECDGGDPCGRNASFSDCAFRCPNQYCPEDDSLLKVACKPGRPCPPGCVCKHNYRRKSFEDDTCILANDCTQTCSVPEECRPTCAVPNPQNCEAIAETDTNEDGCRCKPGYVLSEIGGTCIPVEECPTNLGCNGDQNAVIKSCPLPCPSTCDSPNAVPCRKACEPIGCECLPGYILSEINGQCIEPDNCYGGNPCGENETFVPCKYNCLTNYCPVDDSLNPIICDPTYPCLSGCACKFNYRRRSYENPECIASYDCEPVNCTRTNEVWDSCPSECGGESCENINDQAVCNTLLFSCNPRCVCKEGTCRDTNGICIPAEEYP